jgi:AraC-like DNA-binding protein
MTDWTSLIGVAAATSLIMLSALAWQMTVLPGRKDIGLSLTAGACFFLYRAAPETFGFLLLVLFAGPLICNRAIRAGFEHHQRPVWLDALLLGTALVSGIFGYVWGHSKMAASVFNILSLGLFLEPVVLIWRGLGDDLIEIRRCIRLWFLGAGTALSLLIALVSIYGSAQMAVSIGGVATLGFALIVILWGRKFLPSAAGEAKAVAVIGQDPGETRPLNRQEVLIRDRLRQMMTDEKLYSTPNLTLSRLAQRLDVPEHRLRRVIRAGEGHKHFSAYLNAYRLKAFKVLIEDKDYDQQSILSLAFGVGYNALSAFNRAFKAAEGMTPSAYRQARIAARTARKPPNIANTAVPKSTTESA